MRTLSVSWLSAAVLVLGVAASTAALAHGGQSRARVGVYIGGPIGFAPWYYGYPPYYAYPPSYHYYPYPYAAGETVRANGIYRARAGACGAGVGPVLVLLPRGQGLLPVRRQMRRRLATGEAATSALTRRPS